MPEGIKRIGDIEDYSKLKPKKHIIGYDVEEISTIGQRFIIEENTDNMNNEELMCFILAVAMVNEPNIDAITKVKDTLMNMPYLEVLPTGFFLLKNFVSGKIKERKCFNRFILMIKMIILGNKRGLKN